MRRTGVRRVHSAKKRMWILASILLLAVIGYYIYLYFEPDPQRISYNEFIRAVDKGKVAKVYLDDRDLLRGEFKGGTEFITDNPRKEGFKEELLKKGIAVDEMARQSQIRDTGSFLITMGVFGGFLYFLSTKTVKQAQGGMGKISSISVYPEDDKKVTFDDVAGIDEARESMKDVIDFIRNPEKYARYGARLPRGIILYGPPGTGKTLLAKAVAGEAGVPFYAVSGSDFVQVYVGVGAGRIRDLFKKARESGKCVIFIDEIDALGKKRDRGIDGGGNDERDQTLNALLAEMSGFKDNEGIVVIGATNRLDVLDPALLRPGRFDRHIEVGLPDVKGRYEILKLHSRGKPLSSDVDLYKVAQQTVYFSGAKLESLMNEAAILAAKRDSGYIEQSDIDKAFYIVMAGLEKKDRSTIDRFDREITAFHEAGHALVTKLIAPEHSVSRVTIIPSTKGMGGFSMNIPPDRMYYRKRDMENTIKIALAGRAAEEIVFGQDNVTTGASNDLERATEVLLDMIRRFGMGKSTGLLNYDVLYSNGIRQVSDEVLTQCSETMNIFYEEVKGLLIMHRDTLEAIATALLEKETLDEDALDQIIMERDKGRETA
ncbi:ATP-dependent zinc metalloprotease FtsH [Caldicoprobacter algeriensis]|uniref:ATP-dependent zinc metalloprotease FtsH n=1 Tax=Caldicoprobacter algeriensis TaxID=699281 RepID=UPI0020796744|nr:ATP-dependent zinc metalloprotease FtsH [Caldicoprobacter algeriensis]MCM8900835.1 ATP-dependent zinc metalloprotease FtsH [Caldicoprobacter algeriensis]